MNECTHEHVKNRFGKVDDDVLIFGHVALTYRHHHYHIIQRNIKMVKSLRGVRNYD